MIVFGNALEVINAINDNAINDNAKEIERFHLSFLILVELLSLLIMLFFLFYS